jgi:transposase
MRGDERVQGMMFATVVLEDRVPADHPLRAIRRLVDPILRELSPQFEALYSQTGPLSIPPEQRLRALLLQLLYSIRSERQIVEQLEHNLLFRWFVGLDLEAASWHATTFTKKRQRLLDGDIAAQCLARTVPSAEQTRLLSREHFSVDGTLLEAWASQKRVRPKDEDSDRPVDPGNDGMSFHGEQRSNATHQSVTDPDARMARKSSNTASILAYQASALIDNRHGLVLNTVVSSPHGRAEIEDAVCLLQSVAGIAPRATVGADKGYDTRDFVEGARAAGFTPHVAEKAKRSALDGRTTRHLGYAISQRARKKIEEVFGWLKTVAGLQKVKHRGTAQVDWIVTFACAAYNLVRLRRLIPA